MIVKSHDQLISVPIASALVLNQESACVDGQGGFSFYYCRVY